MKKIALSFLRVSSGFLFAQQQSINLSDLRLIGFKQEILQQSVNRSMTGGDLRVASKKITNGISVHAIFLLMYSQKTKHPA